MILLFIFLSIYLGVNVHSYYPFFFIPVTIVFFIIITIRSKARSLIPCLVAFSLFFTISLTLKLIEPTSETYEGIIIESKDNYYVLLSFPYRFYVQETDNTKEVGDIVRIKSKPYELKFVTYESGFDFKEYLNTKGIRYELKSYNVEVVSSTFIRANTLRRHFLSYFDKDTSALIDAFLFSNKDYSNETISIANSLSLVYLFSTSGIYYAFVMSVFRRLFKKTIKHPIKDFLPYIILLPFYIFLFKKIGVVRLFILSILRLINRYILKERFKNLDLVALSGIIILLFDYTYAYQSSFLVGMFLSVTLNLITPIIKTSVDDEGYETTPHKLKILVIPIIIFFFMLPLSMLNKGEFHLFYLPFSILLTPFNELFMLVSLISFYTVPFSHILGALGNVLAFIYKIVDSIDLSLPIGDFFSYFVPLYYFTFIVILYEFTLQRHKHYFSLIAMTLVTIGLNFVPIRYYLVNGIYFINVGQGDSILIKNKDHAVLIDTGGVQNKDIATECLIPFLKKKQVYYLDALITTHNDFDHAGGKDSLMKNYNVKAYLFKDDFPYKVGDIYLENLNNMPNPKDENDTSLVFNLDFLGKRFLLMGDASKDVEKYLLDTYSAKVLDTDVIKVGHHGSNTSSLEEFIRVTSPSEAIISCAIKNKYGHPNKVVIETLNKYHVNIRYTMEEGTIKYINVF